MASSIMHLAVAGELAKKHSFSNLERLKAGVVLPDAGKGRAGHIMKRIWGLNKRSYDFEFFRDKFGDLMKTDDLYLGYYLHLVQDLCYRHFVYDKYKWNPTIPGNVEKLHRDYEILNHYVAKKYNISGITEPADFQKEPLTSICEFDVKWLVDSIDTQLSADLKDDEDDIFFFTKEMADEFIAEATDICLKELQALENGGKLIESYDNAWTNMPYSLLETTLNTRDLGSYRIDGTENYTRCGSLIRSDVANYPSEKDIEFLRNSGITTVIDTRNAEEEERKPHGLAGVEGFDYYDIPIDEGSGVTESVEAVTESYFKIAHSPNISKIFRTMAEAPGGVLYNCSAGRTGPASTHLLSCGFAASGKATLSLTTCEPRKTIRSVLN